MANRAQAVCVAMPRGAQAKISAPSHNTRLERWQHEWEMFLHRPPESNTQPKHTVSLSIPPSSVEPI